MLKPVSWRELVRRLQDLGFTGPDRGGKHPFMRKNGVKFRLPNDHREDIRVPLLKRLLREMGISPAEWEK